MLERKIMTENRAFKNLVRARMQITGEPYTAALKSFQAKYTFNNTPKLKNFLSSKDYGVFAAKGTDAYRQGLHLVIGGIGSGKTTARNSIIDYYMNNPKGRRLVMLENENEIDDEENANVIKVFIKSDEVQEFIETKETGPDKLRILLNEVMRWRSDYISYDEIRDSSEAYNLGQCANTGYEIFSTMHAMKEEDAVEKLTRMTDLTDTGNRYPTEIFRHGLKSLTTMSTAILGNDRLRFATTIPMNKDSWDAALKGQLTNWCTANGYESSTMKIERLLKEKVLEYGPHGLQAVVE
jgi:hypothetical protein